MSHTTENIKQSSPGKIRIKVKRQDSSGSLPYWQEFEIPYKPSHNVLSVLMEIRKNPIDISGKKVEPIVWESNCLEEVCGACSMVVNGKARQGCTALIDKLEQPITVEPMDKFPVIRDLAVDRSRMFESLKKVKAWVEIDGTHALGAGPKIDPDTANERYKLSTCMTCGVCLQVCPQISVDNDFIGAAPISQARLFNMHPIAKKDAKARLDAMMHEGGIADCGNAQNCVEACPKKIPLTESIADVGRQTSIHAFKKWLGL